MTRGAWIAALALATLGCETSDDEVEILVGDHVELHVEPGLEACGDLVAHMDAFTAAVADALDVDLAGLRFEYHWYTEEGFARSPCGPELLGCAFGVEVHSRAAPHDHELVHSVSFEMGRPLSFFLEGLAVAFEMEEHLTSGLLTLPGTWSVAEAIASSQSQALSSRYYPLAGAFTRFMVDRYGFTAYREFYTAGARDQKLSVVEANFKAAFGEPLADAIAAFDAEWRACPAGVSSFKLLECDGSALGWDGDLLEVRRSLRCGDQSVVGPFYDNTARVWAAFEVAEPGAFALTFASESPGSRVALTSCAGCDGDWVAVLVRADDGPREVFLPAGRYALQFAGPPGLRTAMALRLRRVAGGAL